jgi:hypothetical protein
MTDYKNIFGKPVKFLATDPDNAEAEGQIWYNSTADAFKSIVALEAWSSASPLITAKREMGSAGTQTAGLSFGGVEPTGSTANTEEYNGSGWSEVNNMSNARSYLSGCGTQTAALAMGGYLTTRLALTEEYDGSSWTAGGNMGTARSSTAGAGTQTSGLVFGGYDVPPAGAYDLTEEYNGTSWTAGGALGTARYNLAGCGTQTAGLAFGGSDEVTFLISSTEEYNGTAWTEVNDMNNGRYRLAGNGIQTAALAVGGTSPSTGLTTLTENYDGTNWTTSPATLATATRQLRSVGSNSTALAFGGETTVSASISTTEEFNKSINVITAGAWASGGNMNTGRGTAGDCGTYLAGLVFGGNPIAAPYQTNVTEEYNGSTWSTGGNTAQDSADVSGAGTQTAGLAFGFSSSPNTITQHYDGSTWTTVPGTLPTQQSQARGIGTQTAAISVGYSVPGTGSFEYDGSTWTAGGTTNNSRSGQKPGGWGIQTAAVIASGYSSPPATIISNTETYDGTSWTETGHSVVKPIKRTAVTTAGTSSDGMLNGGGDEAGTNNNTVVTQGYNGTAWFTQPSLATARINQMGFGTSANGVVCGGNNPPGAVLTATEEFTGETSALNIKTITTS